MAVCEWRVTSCTIRVVKELDRKDSAMQKKVENEANSPRTLRDGSEGLKCDASANAVAKRSQFPGGMAAGFRLGESSSEAAGGAREGKPWLPAGEAESQGPEGEQIRVTSGRRSHEQRDGGEAISSKTKPIGYRR